MAAPSLRQLDDLRALARGRLGLIIGPGATLSEPNGIQAISEALANKFHLDPSGRYLELGARAVAGGAPVEEVRTAIGQAFTAQPPAPGLSPLAKVGWSGVVSITPDDFFETRLQSEREWRPARRDITVLTDPRATPRERTTPVFKLLGSVAHGNALATTSEYLLAKARWERVVLQFLETVRASPVLVVGLAPVPWAIDDLLPHLFAHHGQRPGAVVFLHGDPILDAEHLSQLVPAGVLHVAAGSIVNVARALTPEPRNQQLVFDYGGQKGTKPAADLSSFGDLVVYVNEAIDSKVGAEERERLLDYLFLPDLPNWDALVHGLDFERTISAEIEAELLEYREKIETDAVFELTGGAATGKTTILKRVALNVAKTGAAVLWARDYRYSDSAERFTDLFNKAAANLDGEPLYLFIDTPVATRDVSSASLIESARSADLRLLVVSSSRRTETVGSEAAPDLVRSSWALDDALDDLEWSRLAPYLVHLGLQPDEQSAIRAVADAEQRRKTRDTLAALYFLLPQSRQAIRQSVAQEYLALGSSENLRELLRARLDASPDVLRRAYALVAVSDHHGVPLPIEVLVAALGVNYTDWLTTISAQTGPAFGLLYADDEFDPESAAYRTRNDVVTEIIVDTINGGALSKQAEASSLEALLRACSGTNPIYSRYCTHILTPWRRLQSSFDFTTGLRLYDAALGALPFPHRTILHHKAIWQRKMGDRPSDAVATLEEALAADRHLPHGESTDAEEHIRTSKAAAILHQVRLGEIDKRRGRQEALRELERARSSTFLNPNAVHVYAGLIARMIQQDPTAPSSDKMVAANQAVAEVDRTILLMRSSRLKKWVANYDVSPLHEVRDQLLSAWSDDEALEVQALEAWSEHEIQEGFALATRRRLGKAHGKKNQGSTFKSAFDYWTQCTALVRKRAKLSPELAEVGATLYYGWQIRPRSREKRPATTPLDWTLLEEMARVALGSLRYQQDLFYRYLYGLALAHLGKWEDCHAVFVENRRTNFRKEFLHTPQDYLLDGSGLVRRLQGRLKRAQRSFFLADELRRDFITAARDAWPSGEQIIHAQLVFTFAGPLATLDERACGLDLGD